MKQFNTTIATLSIAAASVFAVAGVAKADGSHTHSYSHLPHSHTYSTSQSQDQHGNNLGNAIVLGGLLIGGIALLDALSNSNAEVTGHYGYVAPKHYAAPKPYNPPRVHVTPKPAPKPAPKPVVQQRAVNYTTSCRDHGHIGISWDAPHEFTLRRPNGSVLETINARRPVMKRVAHALDALGLDTTCVIKTVRKNGKADKTRLFLANGRLPRVGKGWSGADRIIRLNPDNLVIDKDGPREFRVEKPNGVLIQTFDTRKQARAFIAFLDEKNARKKVVIQNRAGEDKFSFFAR